MNIVVLMLTSEEPSMTFRNKRTAKRAGKQSGQTRRMQQMEHVSQVFVQIQHYRNEGRGWRFIADMLNMGGVSCSAKGWSVVPDYGKARI